MLKKILDYFSPEMASCPVPTQQRKDELREKAMHICDNFDMGQLVSITDDASTMTIAVNFDGGILDRPEELVLCIRKIKREAHPHHVRFGFSSKSGCPYLNATGMAIKDISVWEQK